MRQTFKERLKILMAQEGEERPYSWAKKVGIQRGLFQYYWQKGKVPTYENLIKIQNHTGCSIDWLLTGKTASKEITNLNFEKSGRVSDAASIEFMEDVKLLKNIYRQKGRGKIFSLHDILTKLSTHSR